MDGELGHGNRIFGSAEKDTAGIQRDIYKDYLAMQHGVVVIRIDACHSELAYLKENLSKSILNDIFDLSAIDWNKCEEFACKNLIKTICNDKLKNPKLTTHELSEKYGLSRATLYKYFAIGNKYNWCVYDPNWGRGYVAFQKCSKPLICNDKYIFDSISTLKQESEKLFDIKVHSHISKVLKNENGGFYRNLYVKFIDKNCLNDYINNSEYIFIKNKKFG